jgi:hypothetical protein
MKKTIIMCSLAAVLSACGGGGGDSGDSGAALTSAGGGAGSNNTSAGATNNTSTGAGSSATDTAGNGNTGSDLNSGAQREVVNYPVSAALTNFFGSAATYRLAGTDAQGTNFQLTYEFVPSAATAGASKKMTGLRSALVVNGGSPIQNQSTFTYTTAPFTLYGTYEPYTQFPTRQPAPTTAAVGSSGPLVSGTEEGVEPGSGGMTSNAYAQTITWNLAKETATTAWLCINTTTHSQPFTVEKDCARINEAGVILGYKASVVDGDFKLDLQQF